MRLRLWAVFEAQQSPDIEVFYNLQLQRQVNIAALRSCVVLHRVKGFGKRGAFLCKSAYRTNISAMLLPMVHVIMLGIKSSPEVDVLAVLGSSISTEIEVCKKPISRPVKFGKANNVIVPLKVWL